MTTTNVAVWGLGNHAINRIIPALVSIDEVRLIGVCSRNRKVIEDSEKQYGCFGWSNPEEMLSHSELDVVYIASPIALHFRMAEQSLKAGKHVWCEKPLTCDEKETQILVALAKKNGKVLTESFMYLHHPQFKKVKQFVDESSEMISIICRFGIPNLAIPGFRNDPKLCGGALWDVASYTTSALLALFPRQKVKVLFSEVVQEESVSVDTGGRAVLSISGKVIAYLEWAVGVSYKNEIDLWSADGSLYTDKIFSKPSNYVPEYSLRDLNGNVNVERGEPCEQFVEMFRHFLKMVGNDEKIEAERQAILRRAKLLNDLVDY
jgi:dTDP-3,4-didehydro-2,6-dideoxy-alpha-D-glucose 3-reductase